MLVKRPLLVDEYHALVGFNSGEWESVFTEYDRKKLDNIFQDYFDEMLRLVKAREDKDEKKIDVTPLGPTEIRIMKPSI